MRERGASLVEYALLIALIAVGATAAVTHLGRSSSSKVDEVARRVNDDTPDDEAAPDPTTAPGDGSTPASTSTPSATSTSTTTTTTTTTTIPAPDEALPSSSGFTEAVVERDGYTWSVRTRLVLRDSDGDPLPGVDATVVIKRRQYYGSYAYDLTQTVTVTTGPDGTVEVVTPEYPVSGSYRVSRIDLTLDEVDHGDWDGVHDTATATP
jgi:Flp pilus assembly pilin Flp